MKIIVIGTGAWGTALAIRASANHAVRLWARSASAANALRTDQQNVRYLPGVALPERLAVEAHADAAADLSAANLQSAELVVIATPAAGVTGWLKALAESTQLRAGTPVVWLSKGLVSHEQPGGAKLLHEVASDLTPDLTVGALSGPSFAQEVAAGKPCALVAASAHPHVREALVSAFHDSRLRVYANDDLIGVELGGAVKNVLAIACGVSDGLALGLNARAALLTRGLAEMTRLGLALGAKAETFMGLSGIGDLVLTATGDLSRNRQVGLALARHQTLEDIVSSLGHVAEGVLAAPAIASRAQSVGVTMPVVCAVNEMLQGQISALTAMQRLMEREPQSET